MAFLGLALLARSRSRHTTIIDKTRHTQHPPCSWSEDDIATKCLTEKNAFIACAQKYDPSSIQCFSLATAYESCLKTLNK